MGPLLQVCYKATVQMLARARVSSVVLSREESASKLMSLIIGRIQFLLTEAAFSSLPGVPLQPGNFFIKASKGESMLAN